MVSRLCISQWQQSMKDLFFPLTFSPRSCYFAVLYNLCFLSALFSTAALWFLPKRWQNVLLYRWSVHTTKQFCSDCAFYWLLCVKVFCFVFFSFWIYFWSWKKDENEHRNCCRHFCHVFIFFRIWLLLKISWFLKCSGVAASLSSCRPSVSLTLEVSWMTGRKRRSLILTD